MGSIVIGLTGGIGSGKSTVAEIIESYNYKVIKSDLNAKEIMQNDKSVIKKITETIGELSYTDGKLNSKYISSIVFANNVENFENLQKLNQIVHPVVIQKLMDEVQQLEASGEKLIFVESALIYEAELDEGFDYIIVVTSSKENVIERLTKSRNMTAEQIESVMKTQISNEEKIGVADFVIDNNANLEKLKESVDFIIAVLGGII